MEVLPEKQRRGREIEGRKVGREGGEERWGYEEEREEREKDNGLKARTVIGCNAGRVMA